MSLLRLHKSSVVVVLIIAALAVLIEVPGRVVRGTLGTAQTTEFEYGWPWVYLRRETYRKYAVIDVRPERREQAIADFFNYDLDVRWNLSMWSVPWLCGDNWKFWEVNREEIPLHRKFSGWLLFADVLIVLIVATIAIAALERRRRRRPGLWSFRISEVLVAMTAVCVLLGWLIYLDREFKREERLTNTASNGLEWLATDETCIAPVWIQSLVGGRLLPKFFWRASAVDLYVGEGTDEEPLRDIATLQYVTEIEILALGDERFPFSKLQALNNLRTLDLSSYQTTNENDLNEITQLTSLRRLVIGYPDDVAPDVLSWLESEMPNCKVAEGRYDW